MKYLLLIIISSSIHSADNNRLTESVMHSHAEMSLRQELKGLQAERLSFRGQTQETLMPFAGGNFLTSDLPGNRLKIETTVGLPETSFEKSPISLRSEIRQTLIGIMDRKKLSVPALVKVDDETSCFVYQTSTIPFLATCTTVVSQDKYKHVREFLATRKTYSFEGALKQSKPSTALPRGGNWDRFILP